MSHPVDAFTGVLHPEVRGYLAALGETVPMDPADRDLHERLEKLALQRGFPLVGRESGRVLELLARAIGARRVFEMGSGFGYSAFWFARGVGPDGQVLGSEKDPWEHEHFDREWADHPLRARVSIAQLGAFEALDAVEGPLDVIFVDIAKADYPAALQAAVARLRPGGLLLADNVLWGGKAAREPSADDTSGTGALRRFNALAHAHPDLLSLILPVGDGLGVSLRLPT